jgi:hypothetical protein
MISNKSQCILLASDSISRLQLSIANNETGVLKRIYYSISAQSYAKYEIELYRQFNKVLFVSDLDKTFVDSISGYDNSSVMEIGLSDDDFYTANFKSEEERIRAQYGKYLIFTGNFNYPPNHLAANRLVASIFPRVRKVCPGLKLLLAGLGSDKFDAPADDVWGLGTVPRLQELIHCSTVYVSPLASGSGMKNKILEALAQRCLVVASTKSVEGIRGLVAGRHYIHADTDDEFVRCIVEACSGKGEQDSIRNQGYRFVDDNHRFSTKNRELLLSLLKRETV